ncbi:MAG: DeoR/GlpR family DNA-binding transcription regulator [Chloroflexota bacterium]
MTSTIFREERLKWIIEQLKISRSVQVNELAIEFGISPSMIRLDLKELEDRGLLQRTHGGAILMDGPSARMLRYRLPVDLHGAVLRSEKEAIGRATAALIHPGDTLMIDSGSTTVHVVRALQDKRGLTVITNGVGLLPELLILPEAQVYLCGGLVNRDDVTLQGEIAGEVIGLFRPAKTIMGIDGISLESGLSADDPIVAATKRKMVAASKQLIVVADHTKLNQTSLYTLGPLEAMHTLVTDATAPMATIETIRERGVNVIHAS